MTRRPGHRSAAVLVAILALARGGPVLGGGAGATVKVTLHNRAGARNAEADAATIAVLVERLLREAKDALRFVVTPDVLREAKAAGAVTVAYDPPRRLASPAFGGEVEAAELLVPLAGRWTQEGVAVFVRAAGGGEWEIALDEAGAPLLEELARRVATTSSDAERR
jgi:hypothetical protein